MSEFADLLAERHAAALRIHGGPWQIDREFSAGDLLKRALLRTSYDPDLGAGVDAMDTLIVEMTIMSLPFGFNVRSVPSTMRVLEGWSKHG